MQLYAVKDLSEEQLRLLKKFINRGGCGDEIDEEQAIALIPKLSYVLLSETKKRRPEVNGFVFLREDFDYQPKRKQDPNLYVELICAENFTLFATLLDAVIAIGKEMKKKYISLSALPSVILLYARKFGFRLILDCESKEPADIKALKDKFLETQIWKGKKGNKSNSALTKNPEYRKFLNLLEINDLSTTVHKKKKCPKLTKDPQGRYDWDDPDNCIEEGFYMVLCL